MQTFQQFVLALLYLNCNFKKWIKFYWALCISSPTVINKDSRDSMSWILKVVFFFLICHFLLWLLLLWFVWFECTKERQKESFVLIKDCLQTRAEWNPSCRFGLFLYLLSLGFHILPFFENHILMFSSYWNSGLSTEICGKLIFFL